MTDNLRPVIVVISSLVARGTVGNRIMVPALEAAGFDVWAVPTIILPFHPGQGKGQRIVPDAAAFSALLDDLSGRDDTNRVVAVMSGYLGHPSQASAISRFVYTLRRSGDVAFLCDPVMGESNGLYVDQAIAHAISAQLVPEATLITPNRFEHDWLTGYQSTVAQDWIVSSAALAPTIQIVTSVPGDEPGRIGNLVIDRRTGGAGTVLRCCHRQHANVPSGTGDLFAALFARAWLSSRGDMSNALCIATASVYGAVLNSLRLGGSDLLAPDGYQHDPTMISLSQLDSGGTWRSIDASSQQDIHMRGDCT